MNTAVMFSSSKEDWATPVELFERLNKEFGFTLDVCAVESNAKCKKFISPERDGLKAKWLGRCWMNPPYGKSIGKWMQKAFESSRTTAEIVVCLVPARTDTNLWHEWAMQGEIRFLRGRVKFEGAKHSAPFPSAIVIFKR